MKHLLLYLITFSFCTEVIICQNIPHDKEFKKGHIMLLDSTKQEGYLNFYASHTGKVKFKKTLSEELIKYSPDEIISFSVGTIKFESIKNIKVIGPMGSYAPLKKCFGEVLTKGKVSINLIYYIGHDPFSSSNKYYHNFCLTQYANGTKSTICLPYNQRLKKKRIEKEKMKLIDFLNVEGEIKTLILSMSRESGLSETVEIIKKYNSLL
ncbi:hypothetical protein JIV24_22220 [Carboxylicivirga sp. N1Y132]|uniref:Uncharacterized protein n=2 Tax=Carboxylicivirga marina TaxID=2800988 RepID=A0ABS1HQX9_9BACT|nr:hypothetical protein [Carboxylicivirga marina]